MRPSWVVFLINTLWALLQSIKRDGRWMMETPWRSSTHLPQSQHPAPWTTLTWLAARIAPLLCVCAFAFCHWPRREFKCDYVPMNRGNHENALQWPRNNRRMRGKIMSLSGALLTFLNMLKKTRVGTDRQKKIQSGASEEERERSNLHALLWLIKGTSQEEHSVIIWDGGDEAQACSEWI